MAFVSAALIALTCISISLYIWNYCWRNFLRFSVKRELNLPGPKKLLKAFLRGTPDELLDLINDLGKRYSSPYCMWMYTMPFIVLYDPNQVKTVLRNQHCLDKGIYYKFIKPIFGYLGLLTAPVSVWTRNRKIITASYNLTTSREFFHIFIEQSLILANKLETIRQNGNEIIFLDHIKRCALDIACDSMLGMKFDSNINDQYFEAVERLKEISRCRMYYTLTIKNYLFFDFIFNLTAEGREQRKISKWLNSLIIETTLKQLNKSNKLHRIDIDNKHKSFLKNMMESSYKKDFKEKIVCDNIITLIIIASETISITLDFAVFMLANFPEVQEKVYKELEELYGTKTPMFAPVKYDDLQYMLYLDRVIMETMRLFPAVPVISRQLTRDIKIDEITLPKNGAVIIPLTRMYRNEKYWPNPLKFDPDRFLPERIKDCPSDYHIPFGDGPRNCIGTKFAMISMKVILASLVRTFTFKVDKSIAIDKIRLKMDINLSPTVPLKVKIEKRNP